MKSFCFVLFLAVANAGSIRTVRETDEIRAPILLSLTAVDPYGFRLEWEPVESDEANPILGYKVKIWEHPKETIYRDEAATIDGEKVFIQQENQSNPLNNDVPNFEPQQVLTIAPNVNVATSTGMKPEIIYEFRVQAFTFDGDGPLSAPMRLQFLKPEYDDLNQEMDTAAEIKNVE